MPPELPGPVAPGAKPDSLRASLTLTTRTAARGLASSLAQGDTVSARVLGTGRAGGVALRIAGQEVEAALPAGSSLRLQAGQSLQLQVARLMPVLELRLMNPPRDGLRAGGVSAQALRASLPAQQPVAQALRGVEALAGRLEAGSGLAAQDPDLSGLGEQVRGLARALADVRQLADPAVLRERVQGSGTFLESTLAAMAAGSGEEATNLGGQLRSDLKAQLLSLRDALRAMSDLRLRPGGDPGSPSGRSRAGADPTSAAAAGHGKPAVAGEGQSAAPAANQPQATLTHGLARPSGGSGHGLPVPDGAARAPAGGSQIAQSLSQILEPMRQAVDGGIARIEVNQLLSARGAPDAQPALYVDLPVRVGERADDVNMIFTRHRRGQGEDAEHVWKVSLDIEPPGLGRIAVQVSLAGGAISTALVAEQDPTHTRLNAGLPDLADALRSAGLEVAALNARQGDVQKLAAAGGVTAATAVGEGVNSPDGNAMPSAVALRYDGDGAPVVTAKGEGEVARQILALAREHRIPMRDDPRLVELLAQVPVGDEIPRDLYVAVAQVLAFVYALTGKAPGA